MINCFAQASLLWEPVKCKWFLIPPHRHHSFFPPPLPLIHVGERCNICHCFIMKCNVASYLWACYLLKYLLVVLALQLRVRRSHIFPTAWQNLLLFNHFTASLWLCPHSSPGRCFRADSHPCHLQGTGQEVQCWRKVMFRKEPEATGRKKILLQ